LSARLATVGKRLEIVSGAIKEGNFEKMAQTIMQESNNMHAVMLDSWPPLVYLNRYSFEIIEKVLELNASYGKSVAAYTFDAGPNAHIYTTSKYENEVKKLVQSVSGVEKMRVCKVGEGLRYSNNHLIN
jgi:diphosphomevalonate decarboxylase